MRTELDMNKWQPLKAKSTSTTGEVASAQFQLSLMNSETLSLGRFVGRQFARNTEDIISPEEANKEFNLDAPVTEPTSRSELEFMQRNIDKQRQLKEIISRGDDTATTNFFGFVSGIAGAAVDPIGILSGKLLGAAKVGNSVVSRLMGKSFLAGTKKRKILEASVEGGLGNLATEVGLIQLHQQEKQDIDAVQNLIMAGVSGAAFPAAIGTLGVGLEKALTRFRGLNDDQMERLFDYTTAKLMAGKNPVISDLELEIASGTKGTQLRNEYEDLLQKRELEGPSPELDSEIVAKADEMENHSRMVNDHVAIREEVNSDKHNIYNNPQAKERLLDIDNKDKTNQDLFEEEYSPEVLNTFDEPDRLDLEEQVLKPFSTVESFLDDITKLSHHCVTSG